MKYEFTVELGPLDEFAELIVLLTISLDREGVGTRGQISEKTQQAVRAIGEEIYNKFGADALMAAKTALFALSEGASSSVDRIWSGIDRYSA